MTGKRPDGTKPVEDSVVYIQTPEGVEETVLISLKLGKGQFGSLSTKQVLELAFGITGDDTTKLFKTMRTAGYTDGIDKTLFWIEKNWKNISNMPHKYIHKI